MFFDWGTPIIHIGDFIMGAFTSLWIAVLVFLLSVLFGTLLALARFKRRKNLIFILATVYVEFIRNTPVLVQIFIVYFGLPQFDIHLSPITAGVLALTVNNSAYIAEIIRAGIQSIHKGQWEAAASIGLSHFQMFRLIVFPLALRNIFPSLSNQFIMILFGTSLLSILDVRELTQRASILNSETFRTMEIFVFVTLMYYVISILSSTVLRWVNHKFYPNIK
ncbi:amino acid ABC transporter permease [Ferviditalea candida]|uniref:Amino acid ABC transporter permease n=1 Tax=Ferviditalea candida TaxID=3108399 RepID=A0ABU5ZGG0_9BACL|nr:amino acid ABC transporter permease [Paenibacillaceae bacterium T2]